MNIANVIWQTAQFSLDAITAPEQLDYHAACYQLCGNESRQPRKEGLENKTSEKREKRV
jgi:hypothetical protein